MLYPIIYKRTELGSIQTWQQEVSEELNAWRTHSGKLDGVIVSSEWNVCQPKNVGKKNAKTATEQAHDECKSNYTKKLKSGYFEKIEDIDNFTMLEPMLAKKYSDYASKLSFDQLYSNMKLDGIRCLASKEGMFSRTGEKIITVPHIHQYLLDNGCFDICPVIDGELYNHEYKNNFNAIQSLVNKKKPTDDDLAESRELIQYHYYDCFGSEPFSVRYKKMKSLPQSSIFQIVEAVSVKDQDHMDSLMAEALEDGGEGQIIRVDGPYEHKRSSLLLKRKEFEDAEFEIVKIEEGVGNRAGIAGRVYVKLPDGKINKAGIKGTREFAKQLLDEADEYVGGEVTVTYFGYTPDGYLRFPVAKAFYKGKRNV